MVTSRALAKSHVGQVRAADLQEAIGGCSPDPGVGAPAPVKGDAFADVFCPRLDAAQKGITSMLVYQLPRAALRFAHCFYFCSILVFLACSLCKEKGEGQVCSLWRERRVKLFSENCIFRASGPETSMLPELKQMMKTAVNISMLCLCI